MLKEQECCCGDELFSGSKSKITKNSEEFKKDVNSILGRLFSQYYNITFLSMLDPDGNITDFQIHSLNSENKKKVDEILQKALDFKIASTKAAKLLGFESSCESFIRGDSHIIVMYDIQLYLLVIIIEMSKPLIDAFDFEKFNEKIELILIDLRKKIDAMKEDNNDSHPNKSK